MKNFFTAVLLVCIGASSVRAQIQTITIPTNAVASSNNLYLGATITVASNAFATLKSFVGAEAYIQLNVQGFSMQIGTGGWTPSAEPIVVAGPATIQIQQNAAYGPNAFATFDVEPGPFPPNKAVTVGAYAGNVQVTMQMSTDLVSWTPAVNGQVYTNSPSARFFRIQLVTNASP